MDNSQYGKVAVLMGGFSAERAVSLQSGAAVLSALLRQGVDAHAFDPAVLDLSKIQAYDRAFIALHGRGGEDGTIQGALELMDVPYTGSGVLGSALGMDKVRTKLLWKGLGLPTPAFSLVSDDNVHDIAALLGLPFMMKPAEEGSSIGMAKVESVQDVVSAWECARQYDSPVIAEAWVEGKEYTAAVLNGEALPLIKLATPHIFYDYDAKYSSDSTEYACPCGLPEAQEDAFKQLSIQAFNQVGGSGWGRVDFMLDRNNQPWLLEVNTVPGMTDHSLVPMAAKVSGRTFEQLVIEILATSFR